MNMHATAPDLAAIKSRQQTAWSSGDYAMIGVRLQLVGEMLCEAVDLRGSGRRCHAAVCASREP